MYRIVLSQLRSPGHSCWRSLCHPFSLGRGRGWVKEWRDCARGWTEGRRESERYSNRLHDLQHSFSNHHTG